MRHEMDDIWLKAAVAGGLWASFEIIVGSMLHNLHLPFSGTILATFSVILMIAFLQVWNTNGLIWRAGLICGLMKSLSPSAVILGPMTGIMMEAVMMDLVIYVTGKHLIGYLVAGIGALLSTILHKLASLFLLYGTDLVTIYTNLFQFIKKQLNLDSATPRGIIIWIIGAYFFLGTIAALTGYFVGRFAIRSHRKEEDLTASIDPFATAWKETSPGQSFRVAFFFLHAIMIPGMLLLLNRFGLKLVSIIPAVLYISFLLAYYKRILGRLKKPFFWSQLLIMTLVAGFFWNPPGEGQFMMKNGFLVGIEMSLRAVLIVSAFSALSVEIRNPRITESLLRLGFGNAYASLSLAFNILPAMLDRSSDLKSFVRRPLRSFVFMLYDAGLWLQCYKTYLRK